MSDARSRPEFSVGIGFPVGAYLPWQTAMSLARTTHALASHGIPANIHAVAGSSLVTIARDVIAGHYLSGQERFLFFIDSDIVWTPEDFIRVLGLAAQRGIVSAGYSVKREPEEIMVTFVDANPVPDEQGCVEILSAGLGFTCIRRDIFEEFETTKTEMYHSGNGRMILDAFRLDTFQRPDGVPQARGEDGAFFADIRALGHKVWLDATINLGHVGTKVYRLPMAKILSNA
jgi:hypothetical protein